ncbi:MAG: glycosyltransferase family 2 protein [Planctomycetota bacterium]|nr:glycosyltransferase family 2 protein [Planctomycetota bacterium]MDA1177235.1 glycosyltransferase family 2 protein [Planctomycetota bacterium]
MRSTEPSRVTTERVSHDDFNDSPSISVIVPVRNEGQHLANTLDMLANQSYPKDRFEIIVVDGESTDNTRTIAQRYSEEFTNIRWLPNPQIWSSSARNIGIHGSHGEIVLIVDGHCQISGDQHLQSIANGFRDPTIACLGRPQPQDVRQATLLQQAIAAARSSRIGHHPNSFIYAKQAQVVPAHSVAVAYRRTVFDIVGYFDETFDACEDVELNHRIDKANLKCLFDPRVAVAYHPRSNLSGLFRQLSRYGRGRIRLGRKHRDTLSIKTLIPAGWLIYMAMIPFGGWFPEPIRTVYWTGVGIYFLTILLASISNARHKHRLALLFWLPVVFLTIHAGAAWGLLSELLWPQVSPRPEMTG